MIVKEFTEKEYKSPKRRAGQAAEKQMAFYLKREFQDAENIFILNDVRVSTDDDNAQIDHLIVYPAGVVIVESKSVGGEMTVNTHGEWIRVIGSKKSGMPSPITQARTQARVLKKYLSKLVFFNGCILPDSFHYDVFVAVSDNGIINREYKGDLDELCKADQIARKVRELAASRLHQVNKRGIDLQLGKEVALSLNKKNAKKVKVAEQDHKPKYKLSNQAKPTLECSKCKSTNVFVAYGRNYYLKCLSCDGNTPLQKSLKCIKPNCQAKLRKSKNEFFKECSACETSVLFFKNPK